MRILRLAGNLATLLVLCGVASGLASARELEVRAASLRSGAGSMTQLRLSLDWPDEAASGRLRLRAASLDFPALGYQARDIDWQCPLERDGEDGWRCRGQVRVAGGRAMPLALEFSPATTRAELQVGASRLAFSQSAAAPGRSRIDLAKVPVAWLQAFLAGLWAEGRWSQGSMDGRVDLFLPTPERLEAAVDLGLEQVSLETPDGMIAGAGLRGRLGLDYRENGGKRRIDGRLRLGGGEALVQGLYVVLPATPVEAGLQASQARADAPWSFDRLYWRDPGALELEGKGRLRGDGSLGDLDLRLAMPDLGLDRDRYLSGFLAPAGFADLLLAGRLDAELRMVDGGLQSLDARLAGVNAVDRSARFTFAGIDGDLRWRGGAEAVASGLAWRSGAIYGIGLGPAAFAFRSADRELSLAGPVNLDVLGGRLKLEQLRWQAPTAERGARFDFGLGMDGMDLASLSQRLGWPAFRGTVGGRIPSAHYQDNVLRFDGSLGMDVFGGQVRIDSLVMERPFGVAPTLSADVAIEDIDLEPMTEAFGFGKITGRMDGRIDHLRLVDWSPAAFDAFLGTDRDWKGKRRISQRAVNDISSVGGSGLIAGVQAQVLRFFDDFGYDRIGLGCRLQDNVCRMEGVGSAGDGYIIVAGAGLPRIQVVGFRRQVDWPTLVKRLKAATEGQTPVIQ